MIVSIPIHMYIHCGIIDPSSHWYALYTTFLTITTSLTFLVATVSLELDVTLISEEDTFLEVCANVTDGSLERDVEVQLSSMSGSADGNEYSTFCLAFPLKSIVDFIKQDV